MAIASDYVTTEIYEVGEFPDLAEAYNVDVVPKLVLNETANMEGAPAELELVEAVLGTSRGEFAA